LIEIFGCCIMEMLKFTHVRCVKVVSEKIRILF
jgi:hypothetical protein